MLYLVRMDIQLPYDMPEGDVRELQAAEQRASHSMQSQGKLRQVWRAAGEYANYCLFDVENHDELHGLISSLPMYRHINAHVVPLATHPNDIRLVDASRGIRH